MDGEKNGGGDTRLRSHTVVDAAAPRGMTDDEGAAIKRWVSLPEEERDRLIMEYGNERMRLARLSEIP